MNLKVANDRLIVLESQINNRTTIIAPVCEKQVVITSYYDFNREETIEIASTTAETTGGKSCIKNDNIK